MNAKRLFVTAALGVGLLGSSVQAFARDRDDFRSDRREDRREFIERQDRRIQREAFERREAWERREALEQRRRYAEERAQDGFYSNAPAYGYSQRSYGPAVSGSFYFGSRR